jgi:hypothetical protein
MILQQDVVVLADHSVLLAIPAFAPAFIVAGVVAYIAIKDRRKGDGPQGDGSASAGDDDRP